jgi:hypothetical protein
MATTGTAGAVGETGTAGAVGETAGPVADGEDPTAFTATTENE